MNEHLFIGDTTYPHTEFVERVKEKLTEKFEHELINGKSKVAPSGFLQETYPHTPAFNLVDSLKQQIEKLTRDVEMREDAAKSAFKNSKAMQKHAEKFRDIGELQKDRIEQLERKLAEAQEDAERYRFIRNISDGVIGLAGVPCVAMPNGMSSGYYLNAEHADFAIDAAIQEWKA